jgi:hypothetical protein
VVDELDIPVLCYGLRTDFRGELFPGSAQLLAWADNLVELKTICHCGRKAIMVVRVKADGTANARERRSKSAETSVTCHCAADIFRKLLPGQRFLPEPAWARCEKLFKIRTNRDARPRASDALTRC